LVENYPGIKSISGLELSEVMRKQVESLGVEIKLEQVTSLEKKGEEFLVRTERASYPSKSVILATGAQARKLGIEGEDKFLGKGVSYCAVCDGPLFKGKKVAVVGGGDSAVTSALFLADYADQVFVIHRRDQLRAEPYLQEKLLANEKVDVLWNKVPAAVKGEETVEKVLLRDVKTSEVTELEVNGIFIEVGNIPTSVLAEKLKIEVNERGYVKVDKQQRTNVAGLFAAGDVTDFPLKQISTAVGQGAVAGVSACSYVGK
jgi:thioredoxin reductase (NADPH)